MKEKFKYIIDLFFSKEMGILPAGLAFSFFFAVIPIISLIFYLVTSINFSMDAIQNLLNQALPGGVVALLQPVFIEDLSVSSLITLIVGLIVVVNGCGAIIIASNTIYDIKNARIEKRILKSIGLSIIMILLIAFIVIVPLLGNSFLKLLGTLGNFISENEYLINVIYLMLQIPISLLVIFLLVKVLYMIAPDQYISGNDVNKGTIFTTVCWLLLTTVFSYYISNIARYDLVYGNLANIVILMFWFYLLAYVFVIGMVINKNIRNASIEKTNTIKLEEIREKIKNREK